MRLLKTDPHVPASTASLLEVKLSHRATGGAWGSSKGRIFRIKFLCPVPRPDSWSALHPPNGIHIFKFLQTKERAARNLRVDADWRRVPCRALNGTTKQ